MNSPADDSDLSPVFEPFKSVLLRRLDNISRLTAVADWAIGEGQHAAQLEQSAAHLKDVLHEERRVVPQSEADRLALVRQLSEFAKEEVAAGMPVLYGSAAVLLWGALETAIRDFAALWIEQTKETYAIREVGALKVRIGEYELLSPNARAKYVLELLERDLGSSMREGVGRFTSLLRIFGLVPKIDDDLRRSLNELSAIRNVTVHRAGVADDRFLKACPNYPTNLGEEVRVTREAFIRYSQAVGEFAASVVEAAIGLRRSSKPELGGN